jgi:hypothetical protein
VPKDAQEEFLDQVIEKSESLEQKAPERYWIVHSPNILHSLTCLKDQSLVSFRYAISWTCHWGWFMNPLTFSMLFLPVSMDIYVMCVWMCFLLLVILIDCMFCMMACWLWCFLGQCWGAFAPWGEGGENQEEPICAGAGAVPDVWWHLVKTVLLELIEKAASCFTEQ